MVFDVDRIIYTSIDGYAKLEKMMQISGMQYTNNDVVREKHEKEI